MGNGGVCVWTNSTFANFKINKQTKRKRNSRGQLQGRLMHHSNLLRDGGISASSDFASRNKDTHLTFILNCRSDYLVAYPQKKQKIYKTKISRMKLTF